MRITRIADLIEPLSATGVIGTIAASALGRGATPVRAVLFDKSAANNWSLAWHQDRTVVVKRRKDVEGYGPWSTKAGLQHVAPPFRILEQMVTLRVHLDPVEEDNAPLLVALGSHRLGTVPESQMSDVFAQCGLMACVAEVGDVWLYATPIVHASNAALRPRRRRVLQVDYAAIPLDGGLEWLGV